MNIVDKARHVAMNLHDGQKYGRHPYIRHIESVVSLVSSITDDEEVIASAWLHDVVEDTEIKIEQIYREFGDRIGRIVELLTHIRNDDYVRGYLFPIYFNEDAKLIKLCDLISNIHELGEIEDEGRRVRLGKKYSNALRRLLFGFDDLMKVVHVSDFRVGLNNVGYIKEDDNNE